MVRTGLKIYKRDTDAEITAEETTESIKHLDDIIKTRE